MSDEWAPAGIVVTPEGGIRAEPAAPRSSASVVLGVLLRTLGLGVLVVIYGALCVTIGFGPFVLLLVVVGALKTLMPSTSVRRSKPRTTEAELRGAAGSARIPPSGVTTMPAGAHSSDTLPHD